MANLEFMQVPRDPAPDHVAMSYKRAWQERLREPGAARRQPGSGRALERPASYPTDGATIMASVGPFQGPICPFLGRLVRMVCQATDERLVSAG